jgi:phospholipid/cholesterol/gamma-HCH transport system substrate-binding protein
MLRRIVTPAIVVTLIAVGAVVMLTSGNGSNTVTAYFPRTVSIYEGSDVRVLGVAVGTIDQVTPEGTKVKVVMRYDSEVEVPDDAQAVIISPAIVGDRYVQLTPAYVDGPKLPDNAVLEQNRTAVPLELDEIFESLDRLTVALGPTGANRNGALTDLLETTAENFGGQGARFRRTIRDFSTLSETLDDNRDELFGSLREFEGFMSTLAENDDTVRAFNQSLGQISTMLSGERQELADALGNLRVALQEVGTFVKQNRRSLGRNIRGLNKVAQTLVRRRNELDQQLRLAPVALNNLLLGGNPDAGTLDTNANMGMLVDNLENDPAQVLCNALSATIPECGNLDELNDLLDGLGRTTPSSGSSSKPTGPRTSYDPSFNGLVEVVE